MRILRTCFSHGSPGFTLGESTVALTLTTGVLLAVFATLQTGTTVVASQEAAASAQNDALTCLQRMLQDMPDARIIAVAETADSLTFQVPIYEQDPNYDFDPDMDVSWGSPSTPDGGSLTYRFALDRTLTEATEDKDLNRDGDQQDTIHVGRMEAFDEVTGSSTPLSGNSIALVAGDHTGDVNGDGIGDPIFEVVEDENGKQLIANLWALRVDKQGSPYLLRLRSRVALRNSGL